MPGDGFATARKRLAERIRASTQIDDPAILRAFELVERHRFVPDAELAAAYDDRALPLDEGQTISQPSMIAIMLSELGCKPEDRALEVGAGSGYAAALLAALVGEVHALEIRPELADRARNNLLQAGVRNVHVHTGDGTHGLPAYAPFQRILVSAGARSIPAPLLAELGPGGRIAIPVGNELGQSLRIGEKTAAGSIEWRRTVPCIFVPLLGEGQRNENQ